jgi:hypothetical protein
MPRLLHLLGLRRDPSDTSSPLVEETAELRRSIDSLSDNVRDLVVSVKRSGINRNHMKSRNPIEDMVRGHYKGINRDAH